METEKYIGRFVVAEGENGPITHGLFMKLNDGSLVIRNYNPYEGNIMEMTPVQIKSDETYARDKSVKIVPISIKENKLRQELDFVKRCKVDLQKERARIMRSSESHSEVASAYAKNVCDIEVMDREIKRIVSMIVHEAINRGEE